MWLIELGGSSSWGHTRGDELGRGRGDELGTHARGRLVEDTRARRQDIELGTHARGRVGEGHVGIGHMDRMPSVAVEVLPYRLDEILFRLQFVPLGTHARGREVSRQQRLVLRFWSCSIKRRSSDALSKVVFDHGNGHSNELVALRVALQQLFFES